MMSICVAFQFTFLVANHEIKKKISGKTHSINDDRWFGKGGVMS